MSLDTGWQEVMLKKINRLTITDCKLTNNKAISDTNNNYCFIHIFI